MRPERIEAIYDELNQLVIELDRDPGARGPGYLQDLISKTRGYLNKTSLMIHEVHREAHGLERDLAAYESAFQLSGSELLANDGRVTRLPNIDDRKAMIDLILRDDRVKILDLKRAIRELGFVEKAIKYRHKELDNTMSSIRMQKSLIDTEVRTGSFYGDESNTARSTQFNSDDIDEAELARLLGDVLPETTPQTVEVPTLADGEVGFEEDEPQAIVEAHTSEPKTPNSASEVRDEFSKFLDGDDYSDVLDSL